MRRLPKPKLVFWLGSLKALGCIVAFCITVLICYLIHVLWEFILTTTRVVGNSVDQVYINGWGIDYCSTQLLIATIFSNFLKFPTRKLGGCFCRGDGLTISRFGFFFFIRLRSFFFSIKPPALPTASIHFSDTGEGLEGCLRLGLNGFIKHFVLGVQFLMPTIYLGLNRWP